MFSLTKILSNACISPIFSNLPPIFKDLFVETFPLFSKFPAIFNFSFVAIVSVFVKLFTDIPFKATNFFEFISFAVNEPFVKISPVFNTFSVTFISLSASIAPLFINDEDISNFFSVTIFPLFSNLFTAILFFALKTFLFLKSPEVKEASVTIFPLLSTFSFIEISSNA